MAVFEDYYTYIIFIFKLLTINKVFLKFFNIEIKDNIIIKIENEGFI